ncbi:hypothetical protein LMH87_004828 [Akanthomyces muscarius]|uniref:NmrA-like domain-containing protein n=1 Tax=Akanthomyces muscarius TaxID=2231603 RepID=A0A9W8Q6F5_AKAMU|nr:hypothetical protein LMH87_004828 [Akanthomyces muscarius]KAJ4145997.1 hypothetical protein LMH87_004828 [Akanthomyces muscarius]
MNDQWTVRGITRNLDSDAAKRLADQGIEIATADAADESSLLKAFQGATAIYALTNYNWTTATEKGLHAAGEQERTEATNIAKAASQIHSLKHFVMSTLPPASLISNNVHSVPHFDYKYMAYQWIETNLPELASKTTLVWLGWYTSNLANVPLARFIPIPGTDNFIWAQPMVEGVLSSGARAYGKIAIVVTDYL